MYGFGDDPASRAKRYRNNSQPISIYQKWRFDDISSSYESVGWQFQDDNKVLSAREQRSIEVTQFAYFGDDYLPVKGIYKPR